MEALAQIMNEEFWKKNADLDSMDKIYDAVLKEGVQVSREEFDAFMTEISQAMHMQDNGELDEAALENVAGGYIKWKAVAAAIAGCYAVGEVVGRTVYNWTHR